jgi:IS30 family transposase
MPEKDSTKNTQKAQKAQKAQARKSKHLMEEEREEIQECLNHGMTFKAIGKRIGKDQTTVSKEVKRHLVIKESGMRRRMEDGTAMRNVPCPKLVKAPFVCRN